MKCVSLANVKRKIAIFLEVVIDTYLLPQLLEATSRVYSYLHIPKGIQVYTNTQCTWHLYDKKLVPNISHYQEKSSVREILSQYMKVEQNQNQRCKNASLSLITTLDLKA